jgi:hypothetical protein
MPLDELVGAPQITYDPDPNWVIKAAGSGADGSGVRPGRVSG